MASGIDSLSVGYDGNFQKRDLLKNVLDRGIGFVLLNR